MSLNLSYIFINIPNPKLECLFAVPQIALIFQYNRLSAKSKDPSCIRTYHEKGPLDFCRVHGSEKNPRSCKTKYLHLHGFFNFSFFYSLRSASIGFRFAAFTDGSSPNTIPITMENTTEKMIAGMLIATGVCDTLEITCAMMMPPSTPSSPPMLVSTAASVRNWNRILRFLAPIAFFRPISLVRSVPA